MSITLFLIKNNGIILSNHRRILVDNFHLVYVAHITVLVEKTDEILTFLKHYIKLDRAYAAPAT